MNLSFMEPPKKLDFARGPGNGLYNPRVRGTPKAGRQNTAFLLVFQIQMPRLNSGLHNPVV